MRIYTHILRGFGLFLGLACFVSSSYGQQALPFNQYYVVPQWYNPATIGNGEATNIFLTSRFAMMDIPGRPITNGIYADGPLSNDRIGLGAYGSFIRQGLCNVCSLVVHSVTKCHLISQQSQSKLWCIRWFSPS